MIDKDAGSGHDFRIPLVAAICGLASVTIVAALFGYSPWDSSTWSRWDSGLYEDIARNGYNLFRCKSEPTKWCGNAGWLPGYPWIVGGLHRLGLPLRGTAVVVSWLFAAGTIVLLWATFLERRTRGAALAALFYAVFAPGQIYQYAVFPLSMLTFTTVACLWLLYQGRYVAAGIAGALAAVSYPPGVLLAPISAVWLLAQKSAPLHERLRQAAITGGLTLAGFWVFVVVQRVQTGHWDAFFLIEDKYAVLRQSSNPFVTTWNQLRGLPENLGSGIAVVVALQTALITIVLVLVLAHAYVRRRSLDRLDSLLLVWAVATWALPLSQSLSIQRGQAALLPIAVLVARLPSWLAWSLVLPAAAIAIWLENYFLDGTLI